jgi:hypothetical protein
MWVVAVIVLGSVAVWLLRQGIAGLRVYYSERAGLLRYKTKRNEAARHMAILTARVSYPAPFNDLDETLWEMQAKRLDDEEVGDGWRDGH